jgi:sialidase-1
MISRFVNLCPDFIQKCLTVFIVSFFFQGTDLVYKRSFDGGATWSTLAVLYSNSSVEEANVIGNAAPVQDVSTGRIWMPFCRNNEEVFMTYSDDDGATWATPTYQPHLVKTDWKWVGLGPPAGLQLSSGRMVIPGYHTTLWKGDGCASKGHTLVSDDHGESWRIGSETFGGSFLANECQAVELRNGSLLVNARVVSAHRIQVISHDGGITFEPGYIVPDLVETIEGCEGSIVKNPNSEALYFSIPNFRGVIRQNMTVFESLDDGLTWHVFRGVDEGAVSYSAMQFFMTPGASEYSSV